MDYPYVPVVRSASLNGYLDLAQSVGLDAHAMLRRAGLSSRSLENPETPLSTAAVSALMEHSAQASGVEDFGLRLAARRQLSNLGPISLVLKEEPTARAALDTLCRYLRLLNASLLTRIEEHGDRLVIREEILVEQSASTRQSMELAVGVMFRILRELLGLQWKAVGVCFNHRPPRDAKAHRTFFGTTVDFNSEFNGIVCHTADLQAPMAGHNPEMARFAREYLDRALSGQHQSTKATVRQLIAALLPGGRCTSQQVAQHLGVDRRTIHRHLAKEDETFATLLQSVRSELVLRQVQDSDLPLSEVAQLLGFAAPAAFSHWFRSTFGCSVTAWRTQEKAKAAVRQGQP
ncbi:MAG: AraC family transcriptional regulator [Hydrogenophaga sp.]|uniref:AraC family transcriptional regulator n=1 Tax=Hydrogenophaga sp. TaxID=1904254 RepID=UPI0025C48BD8|nr:AraC family transcriptional regulator [Hydrogenophaga sp.]MBT9550090.1 AraC family transcriptional regulator [Hydrogenophaga sp.]